MPILVISPRACKESAQKLAQILKGRYQNHLDARVKRGETVFNYGSSYDVFGLVNAIINPPQSVSTCVDKLRTLRLLKSHQVPVPEYLEDRLLAQKRWKGHPVVVRHVLDGAKNEGLELKEDWKSLPEAPLYTKYFFHKKEVRVVAFKGEIAGMYDKQDAGESWELVALEDRPCYQRMKQECIRAAEVLDIDYVGFDVLYNSAKSFVILEANTGPILTDEVGAFIKSRI